MLIHSVEPILDGFSFVGIHPSVDIYEMFRFEPKHNLSLGVSRFLKNAYDPC